MRRIALLAACNAVAALRLSRRHALAGVAGVAPLVPANAYAAGNLGAALAVFSAANPTVSPFTGFYKDPEHLEGYRVIKADNYMGTLQVRGRDSADGSEFVLDGEIISQFDAVIDFSPKGGPKRLAARFKLLSGGRPILEFPDGNAWARLSDKPDPNVMAEIERDRVQNRPMSADKRSGFAKVMGLLSEDK